MYLRSQLEPIFSLTSKLSAAMNHSADAISGKISLPAQDLAHLIEEIGKLQSLKSKLYHGEHTHRHGTSSYFFLVAAGASLSLENFQEHLQEEFEPECGEQLHLTFADEPTFIG